MEKIGEKMRDVFDPLLHCNAKVVHRGSPKQKFSFNNESSVELNFNIFNFYYLSSWFFSIDSPLLIVLKVVITPTWYFCHQKYAKVTIKKYL